MDWTTAEDIQQQLLRHWNSGRILRARLGNQPLFPLELRFRRPRTAALLERFDEVRKWIKELESASKTQTGFGYEIQWSEINHRRLGQNRIPGGVIVPTEADALRFIGESLQAEQFINIAREVLGQFPALQDWFVRRPFTVLEHVDDWKRILAVLHWFATHPRSGLYLRQVDIPGVDTKFIQSRQRLLAELLDRILSTETLAEEMPAPSAARSFEHRYGLMAKPIPVRFRILDSRIDLQGLTDLTVPVAQFARLRLSVERVFITENEINGLVFPDVPDSIVIFGLGYGVQALKEIAWLEEKELHYWGDIDTHGFAILDRFRAGFPQARSFLMDRETLMSHRELWGEEKDRYEGTVSRLTGEELAVFEDLRQGNFGHRIRLEQELISFDWFLKKLRTLETCGS